MGWGDWIEHDGSGVPDAVRGKLVEAEFESLPGITQIETGIAGSAGGLSWDWSYWQKRAPGSFFLVERILRYRIREPLGPTILERALREVPAVSTCDTVPLRGYVS